MSTDTTAIAAAIDAEQGNASPEAIALDRAVLNVATAMLQLSRAPGLVDESEEATGKALLRLLAAKYNVEDTDD